MIARVFVLLCLFLPSLTLAGFGISPPQIIENNAVPGATFERAIYLVQGNPTDPVTVEVAVDGNEMKDWFSFPDGNTFTIPAGVQQYSFNVTTHIPEDISLGVYKGYIRINTVPDKAEEAGQVAVSIGARIDVSITVGDNVVENYNISYIDILDTFSQDALKAEMVIKNTGNVDAGPKGASFELYDKFNSVRLAFVQTDIADKAPAFGEKNISLYFPIDIALAPGEYWGLVKVFDDNNQVVKEVQTIFQVQPKQAAQAIAAQVPLGALVGVSVVALMLILSLFIFRRLRRK